ncbi:hypothetical protein ACOMHN_044851 [Nucella lapillus]
MPRTLQGLLQMVGVWLTLSLMMVVVGVRAGFIVPGLPVPKFVKLGHVNLGVLMPMSMYDRAHMCSQRLSLTALHYTQGIEYAVDMVNAKRPLPGNVTLGFVVLDDCYKVNAALAQALTFIPQTPCQGQGSALGGGGGAGAGEVGSYDVVAVIGATLSSQSVAVAHLLGPARVPMVSFFSTSDQLTNKALFPYFLRTIPPDRLQFQAIFSVVQLLEWSYVSVVYMQGSYGENGFRQLRDLFHAHGICLAAVHKVPTRMTDKEAQEVAQSLVRHRTARAVIIITAFTNARKVMVESGRLVPAGTFTWLGSDGWSNSLPLLQDLGDTLLDTFYTLTLTAPVPDYRRHFQHLTLKDTKDPWFAQFWEQVFNCSAVNGTCNTNTTVGASGLPYTANNFSGHLLDTISVLTNAVSRVLQSAQCAGLMQSAARQCVTGPRLLKELLATRQQGYTGWIELDSNGDRLGRYVIKQVVAAPEGSEKMAYSDVTVAEFDALANRLNLVRNLTWHHSRHGQGGAQPDSRCSSPCGPHQARVVQEVSCCWLCQPCRVNDRLVLHGTRCQPCPPFTWPDPQGNNTTCLPIPPDTLRVDSLIGIVQATFALFCLSVCLVVFVFFHRHRHRRVIKASSKELSMLMLIAIALGYLNMLALLTPPTDLTCRVNFLLFSVSFTLIYAPLFVRALRIFRIFEASKRSAQQPRLIESSHQLVFSFVLLSVQAVLCGVVMVVYPHWHQRSQASLQERYVELTCDLPLPGLASALTYNLLLVVSCTLLAFKTRHLPDNFNESRFISMCVSTILLVLLCFMPAYLVSSRQMLKMLMLALALAANHSVALIFLFLPKIYAVIYLEDRVSRAVHSLPSQISRERSIQTMPSVVSSRLRPGSAGERYGGGGGGGGERGEGSWGQLQPVQALTKPTTTTTTTPMTKVLQVRPATYSSSDI